MQISKVCPVVQKTIIEKYLEENMESKGILLNLIKVKEKCSELARDPELNGKGAKTRYESKHLFHYEQGSHGM